MMSKKIKGLFSMALVLCLMMALFSLGAYAANANVSCTLNQDMGSVAVYKGTSNIQSCSYNGSIPSGLQLSYIGADIYLAGTPTAAGTYNAEISMQTEAGAVSFGLTVTVTEASTPVQTAPPTQTNQPPVITKNPTGETVDVGGTAQFVARADGATSFVWRIVSADTTNTVTANEASYYFGVTVSGQDTERLTLSNIPKSMNGWAIECKFTNAAGSSYTTGAILTVRGGTTTNTNTNTNTNSNANTNTNTNTNTSTNTNGNTTNTNTNTSLNTNTNANTNSNTNGDAATNTELETPSIVTQPKPAQLNPGERTTLSVAATAPASGILTYQWYVSDTDNMSDAKPIDGANSANYTPTQTDGTKYYCVGVWVSKDGEKGATTRSELVEVSYENNLAPSPSPSASPTATADSNSSNGSYDRGSSSTLIFYIVVAGLALLAVGGILVYLVIVNSRKGKDDDDE